MRKEISDLCPTAPDDLITGIQDGDADAEFTFRLMFADGVRFLMARQLADGSVQCAVEEVLMTVIEETRHAK